MKFLYALILLFPVGIILKVTGGSAVAVFICSALCIVGLAALMGTATENAAYYLGERVGGFLNATFGNAAELLINIFVLKAGLTDVVKASIVGSIIGNILLVLGLSMLCGGLKYKEQRFNIRSVELNSGMLFFALIGMCIPAVFVHTMTDSSLKSEELSLFIAVMMILLYAMQIIFTFVKHKDAFASESSAVEETPEWSLRTSLLVLVAVTVCLAVISEVFTGSVEGMSDSLGLSDTFVGLIMIPIIGNAAEHSTAVLMAMKDKMNTAIEVSIGSTLQVILFVMPVLVFISCIWSPMNLVFTPFELAILIASALITNRVIEDGRSNWFEGAQLLGIYLIIAVSFFIV